MESNKRNVPKLRFPEFTNAWEQRRLFEIADKVLEKNTSREYSETLTNSAEFGIISQREFFDKDISNEENIDGYYIVRNDDFVYNPRISTFAPVGPIKRSKLGRNGVMSPLYYVFRTHDIDPTFLEHFFTTTGWHKFMKLNGDSGARSDRFSIKDSVLREMPLPYPSFNEQKRIGALFAALNHLITLHQRKLEHLQDQKRGLLQKMFPKDGADIPEVRFPEFTNAWEQRRLGELGATFTGLSGKTKEDFGHGGAEFITYMNVFTNPIAADDGTENVEVDANQSAVQSGDVLFTASSETPEEVGMSSVWLDNRPNVYLNSFCFGWRPSVKFDPYYLAFLLRSSATRKKFTFLAQGISRYNISKNKVMKMPVPVPNFDEQQRIGAFFHDLDRLITLHQRKLEHLQKQKRALLQQMFI
jgi:type I restriction enzyme S subunit